MSDEIYTPPETELQQDERLDEVPEKILKHIKGAWVAGVISTILTLVFTIVAVSGTDLIGLDAYAFIDVGVMALLTFGIYKKSRVCAILMLTMFLVNKILMWQAGGPGSGNILALLFLWFYTMGVVGTFQYHRFIAERGTG